MNARWRQHFGDLEEGRAVSFSDLAQSLGPDRPPTAHTPWAHPQDPFMVPTLTELQCLLSATKGAKAPGIDRIPPELCRHFANGVARLLHPLLLKHVWRGCEAIGWKGGQSVYFYKHKGSVQECASYRAVLLLSALAKACHKTLRAPLKSLYVVPLLREYGPSAKIPLVPAYRHLGVMQAPFGVMGPELRHRISQAQAKLLQGAGAWPPLNKRNSRCWTQPFGPSVGPSFASPARVSRISLGSPAAHSLAFSRLTLCSREPDCFIFGSLLPMPRLPCGRRSAPRPPVRVPSSSTALVCGGPFPLCSLGWRLWASSVMSQACGHLEPSCFT